MPFVTTPERVGIKKGMLQLIDDLLRKKFGEVGPTLMPEINALQDTEKFRTMFDTILTATTLDEVRRGCAAAAAPPEPPKASKRRKRG